MGSDMEECGEECEEWTTPSVIVEVYGVLHGLLPRESVAICSFNACKELEDVLVEDPLDVFDEYVGNVN